MHDSQIRKPAVAGLAFDAGSGETLAPERTILHARSTRCWLQAAFLSLMFAAPLSAQSDSSPASETARIDRLEEALNSVLEDNRRLTEKVRDLETQFDSLAPSDSSPTLRLDLQAAEPISAFELPVPRALPDPAARLYLSATEATTHDGRTVPFRVKYDNGFTIEPDNVEDTPFTLKIRSQDMFRYAGFARSEKSWTDSAGNQTPITDSSNFQIPRGRLILSGMVFSPRVSYLLSIDYNTVTSNQIGFRAYDLAYTFDRALELHVGQSKVPGTREWLESAFSALEGPDRTMATTFFRPSLSQGIWITGQPIDGLYYHAMMSNGFNTLNVNPSQLNNRFCWSGSAWWEPWGDFGRGYVDFEAHAEPVVRLGASYTFALGRGSQSDSGAVENSSIRLSDGTLITETGAFAPGVTLQSYDISLAAVDAALKYQGWSLSTEWYAQTLASLKGDGPLPIGSTSAYGGFVQGGYCIIPREVELYARSSFVTGDYGSGSEVGGGFNWFILPGKSNVRYTFDTAWLDDCPADQDRTGYFAGQSGLLIRTQIAIVY